MKTFMASPATIDRKWYVVDAEGKTLGRLASEVAKVLRGKNKPIFTPHIDMNKHPERVIEYAVKGMLPKGPLGRHMYTKLFVYAGPDHKHAAQKPETLEF